MSYVEGIEPLCVEESDLASVLNSILSSVNSFFLSNVRDIIPVSVTG